MAADAEHRPKKLRIVTDADGRQLGLTPEPPDPRDRLEERLQFLAALQELSTLPKRLRDVVLVNSQSHRRQDVADVLGISRSRAAQLMQQVSVYLQQRAELRAQLDLPLANPRIGRLREREANPPEWLRGAIGRVPTSNQGSSKAILDWRRAALAIDDYRAEHGWSHDTISIGPTPIEPAARRAHAHVQRTITQVREERVLRKGDRSRER